MKFTLYVIINHPFPSVSDDKKMTYSQPLFEKMNCPPNNDLLKIIFQIQPDMMRPSLVSNK